MEYVFMYTAGLHLPSTQEGVEPVQAQCTCACMWPTTWQAHRLEFALPCGHVSLDARLDGRSVPLAAQLVGPEAAIDDALHAAQRSNNTCSMPHVSILHPGLLQVSPTYMLHASVTRMLANMAGMRVHAGGLCMFAYPLAALMRV